MRNFLARIPVKLSLWALLICYGELSLASSELAFPEKFGIRLAYYSVRNADTDLTVLSDINIGTGFSFVDDLGGDDDVNLPRLDAFYRFNEVHSIVFSTFRIERDGFNRLTIDLDIGDESYSVGETVVSEINYELFKLGYALTFYHSSEAELSLTMGLNMTDYEFNYELVDGSSADSSEASGPLPMFGIRMSYAITPRWSLHYLTEVLFLETDDAEGSFQNYELDLRYRWNHNFVLGAGLARFSIDITSEHSDWNGKIADTHQGYLFFAGYSF